MGCWAPNLLYAVVTVLGISQMMAACGQKGDLYLPEDKPAATRPAQPATPLPGDAVPSPEAR